MLFVDEFCGILVYIKFGADVTSQYVNVLFSLFSVKILFAVSTSSTKIFFCAESHDMHSRQPLLLFCKLHLSIRNLKIKQKVER